MDKKWLKETCVLALLSLYYGIWLSNAQTNRTILKTKYDRNHNHPLPPPTMASTTIAAATMLPSGSMSSADGIMNPKLLATTILSCSSSMETISASTPFLQSH